MNMLVKIPIPLQMKAFVNNNVGSFTVHGWRILEALKTSMSDCLILHKDTNLEALCLFNY